jgi:hypothetical protein
MTRLIFCLTLLAAVGASACAHVRPNDEVTAAMTLADVKARRDH